MKKTKKKIKVTKPKPTPSTKVSAITMRACMFKMKDGQYIVYAGEASAGAHLMFLMGQIPGMFGKEE
jgi:hypothetical protein